MQEWLRWRKGLPLYYASPAETPLSIFEQLDYLYRRYGQSPLEPDRSAHNALVAEAQQRMEQFHQQSQHTPTSGW